MIGLGAVERGGARARGGGRPPERGGLPLSHSMSQRRLNHDLLELSTKRLTTSSSNAALRLPDGYGGRTIEVRLARARARSLTGACRSSHGLARVAPTAQADIFPLEGDYARGMFTFVVSIPEQYPFVGAFVCCFTPRPSPTATARLTLRRLARTAAPLQPLWW
jgi:hypothetical protein